MLSDRHTDGVSSLGDCGCPSATTLRVPGSEVGREEGSPPFRTQGGQVSRDPYRHPVPPSSPHELVCSPPQVQPWSTPSRKNTDFQWSFVTLHELYHDSPSFYNFRPTLPLFTKHNFVTTRLFQEPWSVVKSQGLRPTTGDEWDRDTVPTGRVVFLDPHSLRTSLRFGGRERSVLHPSEPQLLPREDQTVGTDWVSNPVASGSSSHSGVLT